MNRTLNNTVAVLVVTVFTAFAVWATVSLAATSSGLDSAAAISSASVTTNAGYFGSSSSGGDSSSGTLMTCPRTGCTETYCHATQ